MLKRICLTALVFTVLTNFCSAQTGSYFNQRDDQYTLLGLKRAKEAFDMARNNLNRVQEMFDKGLVSRQDLDQAKNLFTDAEVNYQQSLLAVIFEKQHVSVQTAVKYQAKDGRKHVRLVLANTSGGSSEFKKLINIDDELYHALKPEIINDVYVSLMNDDQAIISQPYEMKIDRLLFGQPATLDFTLLQDLDAVSVNIIYGRGYSKYSKVFLQKDASENKVIVQAEQFSQEVELGSSASLDLTLELFSGTLNTFKLQVVNLPQQINRYFIEPESQARLSQFKFTESTSTRRVSLQVFLPDRPSEQVVIDKPLPFYVLVIPADMWNKTDDFQTKFWTQEELDALHIGYVKLELVPRGIGKLLVRAPQLYYSIKPDDKVDMEIELVNEGTRRLDNIEIEVDAPLNWQKIVSPELTPNLDIAQENKISLQLLPPENVAVGRYEFRIRSTSLSDNRPVTGDDKTVIVRVEAKTNIFGTLLIVLFIVLISVTMVVFAIRLSRR